MVPGNRVISSWIEFKCANFGNRTQEVQNIQYRVWLCSGEGRWADREGWKQPECSGSWSAESVRHSRGVACHQHPEAVQGMFAFFKWVTGSTQYDWMVELKSPLSEAPESFTGYGS